MLNPELLPTVSFSQRDWSLHRKGPIDAHRHNEKVKEAIRKNIPDIVTDLTIITSDGQKLVRVPVRSLELPHFRFDPKKQDHPGQGIDGTSVGDILGRTQNDGQGSQGAGDRPGIDYYDAEMTIDELAEVIFKDLGLPNLQKKQTQTTESSDIQFSDIRKKGPLSNLDKRRTVLENIRRRAQAGEQAVFGRIGDSDLRFRTWQPEFKHTTNAVVIAMRDVSGSMGEFEKYITRSFYFWMVRFLHTKYQHVEIVFITHHTEAKEVSEEAFFRLGESGGTKVSSAYRLALQVITDRFSPERWNVYPFHFSDGDNWGDSDNKACVDLVNEMLALGIGQFGYGEIRKSGYASTSTLSKAFDDIKDPRHVQTIIKGKEDVWKALQEFFDKSRDTSIVGVDEKNVLAG